VQVGPVDPGLLCDGGEPGAVETEPGKVVGCHLQDLAPAAGVDRVLGILGPPSPVGDARFGSLGAYRGSHPSGTATTPRERRSATSAGSRPTSARTETESRPTGPDSATRPSAPDQSL